LRDVLGGELEEMIHVFCAMPRNQFVSELCDLKAPPRDGMVLRDGRGECWKLSRVQVAQYLVITIADLLEQWYSWQENTMSGYPNTGDVATSERWAATLWPGSFRPGSSALSLASVLALHLPALGSRVPPIFGGCTKLLSGADESAAAGLYWYVANGETPKDSPAVARKLLERAIAHNPWVGELHLLLAQIAMVQSDFAAAAEHAQAGGRLLSAWGVQWDKRIPWEGWVIWSRLLAQNARDATWPATLRRHNNLGLIRAEA
jgi:hypothetical protein